MLVDSVIEQQISLKAAYAVKNRLIRAAGKQMVRTEMPVKHRIPSFLVPEGIPVE